jgi:hypothetical protein
VIEAPGGMSFTCRGFNSASKQGNRHSYRSADHSVIVSNARQTHLLTLRLSLRLSYDLHPTLMRRSDIILVLGDEFF